MAEALSFLGEGRGAPEFFALEAEKGLGHTGSHPMETMRVPFKIPKVYAGCARVEGFLIVETEHVAFEYKMSDNWLGALSTGIVRRIVRYNDLDRAEYRLGFFNPSIILTARTLSAFEKLPGADHDLFKVSVPWRHRKHLRPIASEINLNVSYSEANRYRLPGI